MWVGWCGCSPSWHTKQMQMSVKLSVSWADLWWWMPGAALPMETSASCSADQQRRSQWNIKIIISGNEKNWSVWGGKLWLFKKNSWSSGIFSEQVRCLCLGKAMNCSIETDGSFKWTVHPKIKNVIFFFFFFPLTCTAISTSRLLCCGLQSSGDISCKDQLL